MLFLLNNPVVAVVFLISVGFSVVMIKKIVDEIKLNQGLKIKQQAMRVNQVGKGLVKRVSALGAGALAPVAVFAVALVIGLNVTPDTTNTDIIDIQSSADIMTIFEEFNDKFETNYYRGGWFGDLEVMNDSLDMAPTSDAESLNVDQGSDDHSEVNNQVDGVDEMDNVITDGLYIFSIYGNEVQVSKAWTQALGSDALELLHTFTYDNNWGCDQSNFYPMGLYEDEDRLIVVGSETTYTCPDYEDNEYPEGEEPMMDYWWGYYEYHQKTKVLVYSKSDFTLEDEYALRGNFIGTRKIGDNLYVVTSQYIPFYNEDVEVENYLPYYEQNEDKTTVAYEDIVYIEGTSPNSFTSFYQVDLDSGDIDMEVVLGDGGYNLYVSNNNMYLVGNIYYFWPASDILAVEEPVYEQKTAIMRVSLFNADNEPALEFDGIGYVDGYIENQFSMDEYNGNLRVTTTVGWWGDVVNYLWVLDENLKIVGQVGGRDLPEEKTLGLPGERIRSTRFNGDYAYVVTFLQTDPFYVINLQDPENPFIEGDLKITGFSEHLQILDDDHILGIGFEADEITGQTIGLKFNIYDVSDKSNPVEAFDNPAVFLYEEYGYGWTSAIWNHKDLLVNLDKGILSMPFSTYGWNETDDYWTYNSGILLFDLSLEDGIGDHEFIVHEENARFDCNVYKSLFIEDQFYTVSNKYIKVAPIDDPTNFTNSITLREFQYQTDPNGNPEVDTDIIED
jgi:inhibitor of cysteine peptidase